jgi:hypothetical protein
VSRNTKAERYGQQTVMQAPEKRLEGQNAVPHSGIFSSLPPRPLRRRVRGHIRLNGRTLNMKAWMQRPIYRP